VSLRPGVVNRLLCIAAASALPAVVASVVLLARSDLPPAARVALGASAVLAWVAGLLVVQARTRYHLRTLSNLLAALREGDYSFRIRDVSRDDPYGEVVTELNSLSETLRRQRVDDLEATALVRTVMGSIDVAVFAFDSSNRLRQVNSRARPRRLSLRPLVPHRRARCRRQARPVGAPTGQLQTTRSTSPAGGAVGRQPSPARRGVGRVEAAHSGHRP
jgi:HAMP domain-containing protein